MFENLKVGNTLSMASLNQGNTLLAQINAAFPGLNPRLYANQVSGGPTSAQMVPATATQDNSDIQPQSNVSSLSLDVNADGNGNPLPPDEQVYLQCWVNGNFHCVGDIIRYVANGSMTLAQAIA